MSNGIKMDTNLKIKRNRKFISFILHYRHFAETGNAVPTTDGKNKKKTSLRTNISHTVMRILYNLKKCQEKRSSTHVSYIESPTFNS